MPPSASFRFYDLHPPKDDFLGDVLHGLAQPQKTLTPKYFYDQQGSQLFDQITELAEYYPTRTEIGLLRDNASDIAKAIGKDCNLIELGSGSSLKIRLLLDAISPALYMPIDISSIHLQASAQALSIHFPDLNIHAVCADYSSTIELPDVLDDHPRVLFFPGSSIGNFTPPEAAKFLDRVAHMAGPGSSLLIGVDLIKDRSTLEQAYDDASGVTAAFNLNLLTRMNRELGANFDLDNFAHKALYNTQQNRIEMHLASLKNQQVDIAGHSFHFTEGETIHTENSYKYDTETFIELAKTAGYQSQSHWVDDQQYFSLHYFTLA